MCFLSPQSLESGRNYTYANRQLQFGPMDYLIKVQSTIKTQKRGLLTQASVVLEGFSEVITSSLNLEAKELARCLSSGCYNNNATD